MLKIGILRFSFILLLVYSDVFVISVVAQEGEIIVDSDDELEKRSLKGERNHKNEKDSLSRYHESMEIIHDNDKFTSYEDYDSDQDYDYQEWRKWKEHQRKKHHGHRHKMKKNSKAKRRQHSGRGIENKQERKTFDTSIDKKRNRTITKLLNPKPPLDLPIVKPSMLNESNASKSIPTKIKPFHFHIPLISKIPGRRLSFGELMEIAKRYKNPLKVNPTIVKAAYLGQILSPDQLKSMRRMVRDSPALDFLNLPSVLNLHRRDAQLSAQLLANSEIDSETDGLMGIKRSVIDVQATEDALQEIIGDVDDLQRMERFDDFSMLWPPKENFEDRREIKDLYEIDSGGIGELIESESARYGNSGNIVRRKRTDAISSTKSADDHSDHHRVKRGLTKWFNKLVNKEDKTTTTTTPKPSNPLKTKQEKRHQMALERAKLFKLITDKNGDTEIDQLLPKYLRRSSYLERKKNPPPKSSDEITRVKRYEEIEKP